jgi:hypothetical protein
MTRFHDLDEHQFVAPPALLLRQGSLPYLDYAYFHMPTLIYLYAGLMACCPYKLLAARLLSVACATTAVWLLFRHAWRALAGQPAPTRWLVAGGLTLVFLSSRLFTYASGWAWNHDSSVLCLLGALLLHFRGLERGRVWPFMLAGLLLGLAIGIRLSFALAFLPLGLSVCLSRSSLTPRQRVTALALAALATALALVPAWVPLVCYPDRFFFGTLTYPRLCGLFYRGFQTTAMTPAGKLLHLAQTFLTDPGNAVLLLLALVALARALTRPAIRQSPLRPRLVVAAGLLPFFAVASCGMTPTQYQHFYLLLPILFLVAVYAIAAEVGTERVGPRWRRLVLAGVIVAAVPGLPRWYWPVIELPRPDHWVPVRVHRLGEWVRAHTAPGDRVLTIEPAIPLEADVEVYPPFAVGRHVVHVAPLATAEERGRQHLPWGETLEGLLAERPPDAVLLHRPTAGAVPEFRALAEGRHFRPFRTPDGDYELWVRERPVSPAQR